MKETILGFLHSDYSKQVNTGSGRSKEDDHGPI